MKVLEGSAVAQRIKVRKQLGKLSTLTIQRKTREIYDKALNIL